VNLKRGTITVRRSIDSENNETGPKNGNDRELPISNALREELEALPRRSFWVLTRLDDDAEHLRGEARKRASGPGGFLGYFGMLGAMARIVKAAKLDDGERSPWHSLRHTFGSELHRSGASLKLIKEMMDHADIKTTEQYITTGKDAAREAIERAFNNRG
jgi:integrase